jgi:ATP-dependent Lon protease
MQLKDYDSFPDTLPLIVENNMFLYPFMIAPLFIEDELSKKAVQFAIDNNKLLVVAIKNNIQKDKDATQSFYNIAIAGNVMRKVALPDGKIKVLFQGLSKIKIQKIVSNDPIQVVVDTLVVQDFDENEVNLILDILRQNITLLSKSNNKFPADLIKTLDENKDPHRIADLISSVLNMSNDQAYSLLSETNINKRLYKIIDIIKKEIESLKLKSEINLKVNKKIENTNKNYYLKEQLKTIQNELGDNTKDEEVKEFRKKLKLIKKHMPKLGYKEVKKQINRLSRMHPESGDAATLQTYVEQVLEIPFGKFAKGEIDIKKVEKQLNRDHYSLDKPKDRILEYFAVKQYVKIKNKKQDKKNSTVLCFVGPPGVGKTSLANSIAKALKKPLQRIALGGIEDVNELRGHRRTYVGAMPGRLVNAIINAKKMNPVIVLDEIDKIGQSNRGDPTAVMLELLDPEQNDQFRDLYLNFELDLSSVVFVATANDVGNIPAPLRDRMEFIEISSYTPMEKFHIAKNYLIPQELLKHSLDKKQIIIDDETINLIIETFTREAGVRNLRRIFNKLFRKTLRKLINNKDLHTIQINHKNIEKYLDNPIFEIDPADKLNSVGIVNGLAWTSVGGDVLKIESVKFEGKGNLKITGNLGDVMKESSIIAHSVVKGLINDKQLKNAKFKDIDIHLHVPEGATPKDGPSAGAAMALSIASILSNRKVKSDIAMTGELTLSGKILPIGGLKEKLIAANKANMKIALIPYKNYQRDLKDIPNEVKSSMKIIAIKRVEEVLKLGLI